MSPGADTGPIWLIGCGNMAGAILSRWLETGLDPARVTVIDPAAVRTDVRVLPSVPTDSQPDIIMLGVKPQSLNDVVPVLQAASSGVLLISMLAGVTRESLHGALPQSRAVLRVMPNLPVAIGKGAVALCGALSVRDRDLAAALMAPLGLVEWIDDESHFDAVTALSGSGPAFLYRFIEALAHGGAALGLPAGQAGRLALATVEGAAMLAAQQEASPHDLAERVASKGGSTRAALDVLDADAALSALVEQALRAAEVRNRALARLMPSG